MSKDIIKRILIIIVLTIVINSLSNLFVLADLYTIIIIIVSTLLLMVIFDYKKTSLKDNIKRTRSNIFLVSMFLSFSEVIASLNYNLGEVAMDKVINGFKPMVLGLYIYAIFINVAEGYNNKGDINRIDENQESVEIIDINARLNMIKQLCLTRRETEVFDFLLKDMPNKEISEKLYISEATVKKHVQNILKKADCGNRVELIEKFGI